jgi:hypothetical protein
MGDSLSFGKRNAKRAHLLRGHGLASEVKDVRDDVDDAFTALEARTGMPQIHEVRFMNAADTGPNDPSFSVGDVGSAPAGQVGMEGINDSDGDDADDTVAVITGLNLDSGLGYDTLTDDGAAANAKIRFTSLVPGDSKIKVALTHDAEHGAAPPSIAITTDSENDQLLTFTYDGEEGNNSRALDFRAALLADDVANRLIAIDFDGEDGTGVHTQLEGFAAAALAGATDRSRKGKAAVVRLRGVEGLLKSGLNANAYRQLASEGPDEQPSATELRIFFDHDGTWDALIDAATAGRTMQCDVVIDGYQMSFPALIVNVTA